MNPLTAATTAGIKHRKMWHEARARSLSMRMSRALSWYVASSCVAHNERKPRREGGALEVMIAIPISVPDLLTLTRKITKT